jgi:hypothetical protein
VSARNGGASRIHDHDDARIEPGFRRGHDPQAFALRPGRPRQSRQESVRATLSSKRNLRVTDPSASEA